MGTPALGKLGIRLESPNAQGEQNLLSPTGISAALSLTTQPVVPMRLRFIIFGNTTTGTIQIAGKDLAGNPITEITPSIPIAPPSQQSALLSAFDFVTTNVFASVNASGITFTGLANGVIKVGGIAASKFALPASLEAEHKIDQISFNEARGLLDMHTNIIESTSSVDIGKLEMQLYADGCLWAPYMAISSQPLISTIPAIPTTLRSSAAIAASPFSTSLTTQPTAPGMLLQFVITAGPSSGTNTITIIGISALTNQIISETIVYPNTANATLYSSNVYSAISTNGITFTGFDGANATINGVFALQYDFRGDNAGLSTAVLEWFTGTESRILPFAFWEELSIEGAAEKKELQLSAKGQAQDMPTIGDRSTNPLLLSRITSLPQPLESAQAGWQTQVYIDPFGATPLSTLYRDVLDWKIGFKTGQSAIYTATNSQTYNRVYRKKREIMIDITIDFTNLQEYEHFRKNNKRYFAFDFIGPFLGIDAAQPIFKRWQLILAVKYQSFKIDANIDKEKVEAKVVGRAEYDPLLGYSHRLLITNQQSPSFATP